MKYLLIDKKSNQVKAISDDKIKFDEEKFYFKKIKVTKTVQKNIDESTIIYYKNKLEFKK